MVKWLNAHVTIALPEGEYERIKKYPEIKWGAVARRLLIQYLNELEKSKGLLDQSKQAFEKEKGEV